MDLRWQLIDIKKAVEYKDHLMESPQTCKINWWCHWAPIRGISVESFETMYIEKSTWSALWKKNALQLEKLIRLPLERYLPCALR